MSFPKLTLYLRCFYKGHFTHQIIGAHRYALLTSVDQDKLCVVSKHYGLFIYEQCFGVCGTHTSIIGWPIPNQTQSFTAPNIWLGSQCISNCWICWNLIDGFIPTVPEPRRDRKFCLHFIWAQQILNYGFSWTSKASAAFLMGSRILKR